MPWKKGNPFSSDKEEPEEKKPKVPPATLIEVDCIGCKARKDSNIINIRVEHKDNSRKRRACWKCNSLIEVIVDSGGGVRVWQTTAYGKQETGYEKVWKEGDKL